MVKLAEKMPALFFRNRGRFELADAPVPKISGPDDVLIKVERAGICGTDIAIFHGNHPANPNIILGHEYAGTVADAGNLVKHVKAGDRVAVDPNISCGVCYYCRNGMTNQCEYMATGTTLGIFRNGGFAPYNVAPARAVYKLPDDMDFKAAALVEPLSCVMNAIRAANIKPDETVLILGAGPMGALFTDIVSRLAAKVIVSEVGEARIKHVKKFTNYVINPKESDLARAVESIAPRGPDVVIEATGTLMEDSLKLVARGGRVVLFGMNQGATATIPPYDITRKQIRIMGTYIANNTIDSAINVLYSGGVDINHYVTDTINLRDIYSGFRKLGLDPETGKPTPRVAMKIHVKP